MSRRKSLKPVLDMRPVIEFMGLSELIRQAGLKRICESVGVRLFVEEMRLERIVKAVIADKGIDWFINQLSPEQRLQLKQHLGNNRPRRRKNCDVPGHRGH